MTKKKGPRNLENIILAEELQERKFPETSPPPLAGGTKRARIVRKCRESLGVTLLFEVPSKGRVEAFKKVESEEMRDVALFYCLF